MLILRRNHLGPRNKLWEFPGGKQENGEDELSYTETQSNTRSDNFQEKISSQNIKNRSKIIREEEPMDVEPLEKPSIKKSQNLRSNDKEILDIEDPW